MGRIVTNEDRRAAITGVGVVSPFGLGFARWSDALLAGESGACRPTLFEASKLACQVVAEVPGFRPEAHLEPAEVGRVSRLVPMLRLAGLEALRDARLDPESLTESDRDGIDVVVGSGGGGIEFAERQYERWFRGERRRTSPLAVPSSIVGAVASELSLAFDLHGRSHVLSNGCNSAADAIGYASDLVRSGRSRYVLTGGGDACITEAILASYSRLGVLPTRWNDRPAAASRPFAADREGFVLAEGVWLFVLESADSAIARGVKPLAEVLGWGSTCDALHRVAPLGDREQAARAILLALRDGGLGEADVTHINVHGTGTRAGDSAEARALSRVFADRLEEIPAAAIKSAIGHPQGASAAAGVAAVLASYSARALPPAQNLESPDPELRLDFGGGVARPWVPGVALVNCMGFGAKNTALVIGPLSGGAFQDVVV